MKIKITVALIGLFFITGECLAIERGIRFKELSRLTTARDNSLTGYGLVTGLAGTGDSIRSKATLQSVANMLSRFGVKVTPKQIRSRNVAAVMLAATLPPFVRQGAKLDVNVTSMGDARSLVGGTLLMAQMTGPDGKTYALAQGPVSVGGFKYDLNGNVIQKNHPTAAHIPGGATIEAELKTVLVDQDGNLDYTLYEPDFTTASRAVDALNLALGNELASAVDPGRVRIRVPEDMRSDLVRMIRKIENVKVLPDRSARVVINERTGTVVSGGNVRISKISITHGDLKISIKTDYSVSQPVLVRQTGDGVRSLVVPDTEMEAKEESTMSITLPGETSIADLVATLNKVKASSRDIITILQSIKRAGAMHAELIIQ